jgi:hypothetical protein
MSVNLADRHPATQGKIRWLVPNPRLPEGKPAVVSAVCYELGMEFLEHVGDGPQLTIALQHLIDAKDAAVRQAIDDSEQ